MSQHKIMRIADARPVPPPAPGHFVLLLLRSFSSLDLSAVLETLKEANLFDDTTRYSWTVVSEDGRAVDASNGLSLNVDGPIQPLNRRDRVMVLGGDDFRAASTLPVLAWLRRETRKGVACGAIGSAAFTLAKAGLLARRSVSAHWSYHAAIAETCPDIEVGRAIFSLQPDRFTCAGGVSTIDMMLEIIAADHGVGVATWVADRLVCSTPRTGKHDQTISVLCRTGTRHKKLATAIHIMCGELEDPCTPAKIAARIGLSARQLERLFSKYLDVSPKVYYLKLRLEKARNLLQQTDMKITEIALASGFVSQSHFSKVYRKHFEVSPHLERGFQRKKQ